MQHFTNNIVLKDVYDLSHITSIAESVPDPEIPVLTLGDLGVIRDVRIHQMYIEIDVTPTYSGCPATSLINEMIIQAFTDNHITNVAIKTVISPPWSSHWISEQGRQKLLEYGIAPPNPTNTGQPKSCPQCAETHVQKLSEFGSTPCQALWKCLVCQEVFNYFKCI